MPCYFFHTQRVPKTQYVKCKTSSQLSGFTLIELLVSLVIIGVILSVASLTFNRGGLEDELQTEAERLVALLTLTSQEAVLQSAEQGLYVDDEGYRFYQLDEQNQWQILVQDDLLRPRRFASALEVELQIDGETIKYDEKLTDPQIIIFSSGEITPFTLQLRSPLNSRLTYRIQGDNFAHFIISHETW
ncbi:general secretion pathway protein H [Beggiatoa alba B18LD]|uniref:Type II secretion system protein H n=1 Tax=Beggiatoa alba B18LD TaxID=395493 RepID=I3CHA2_9GAMM|nr:type II secretion system minor pseudopilin GspH [Beggiatoa alba]EIJ42995.1 general secretion pathway protein H [Beggiatoa alba B18LD]